MIQTLPYEAKSTEKPEVRVLTRILAKFTDLACVGVLNVLPYPAGPILGFVYSLVCDGLGFGPFQGQSVGKKLFGIQVRSTKTLQVASLRDSVLRNIPVGVATFFAMIPVWGWLLLFLVGIPLFFMEVYLMRTAALGQRLGDVLSDTQVGKFRNQKGSGPELR